MGFALSNMQLKSAAFEQDDLIPKKHAVEGDNLSPELSWTNPPENTQGFAVICHDPDAPKINPLGTYGFVHWVLYNIPKEVNRIEENTLLYTNGITDVGKTDYTGPNPPNGHGLHRYYFWVLALDKDLALDPGLSLWQLLETIEPHVIGMNRLVGQYKRD